MRGGSISTTNKNFNTIQTKGQISTQAHSISNFGGRRLTARSNQSKSRQVSAYKRSLHTESNQNYASINQTLQHSGRKDYKTLGPGPGAYEFRSLFPQGPKYPIQGKTKFDSLYGSKIAQNISPGPGAYEIKRTTGGTYQTIAIKFKQLLDGKVQFGAGPGSYNISTQLLKKEPSAVFGTTARVLGEKSSQGPDPQSYNASTEITQRKSNSRERNSVRPVIGRAPRNQESKANLLGPGPQTYVTSTKKLIGDERSIKVSFPKAHRPISARPGAVR
jgi:hypothetical protein